MNETPPASPVGTHRPQDGAVRVRFSQGGIRSGGASPAPTAAAIPAFIFGGAALAFAGYLTLGRFGWMPIAIRATIVTLLFLVVLRYLLGAAIRGYKRTMNALKMPMEMDPSAPLNVICWPDQMQKLETLMPSPGTAGAFEPEAARTWITRRTSLQAKLQTRAQQTRFGLAIALLPISIQALVHATTRGWIDGTAAFAVVGTALLVPVAWGFVRPAYLRISPGRVDIVRFGWFGSRPTIETHSLRDQPVRLDLRRKELLIGGWHDSHPPVAPPSVQTDAEPNADSSKDDSEKSKAAGFEGMMMANQTAKDPQATLGSPDQIRALTIIPYWASTDLRTIENALFRAAVSTADPIDLPDDELIG